MNKYKVQFTKTFVVDVFAENEEEAQTKAEEELIDLEAQNMQHYNETETPDVVIFDVSNTDDPFNPKYDIYENIQ